MKKVLLGSTVAGMLMLAGCSSLNTSTPAAALNVDVSSELKADIAVGSKISGTAHTTRILGIFGSSPSKFADGVSYAASSANTGFSLISLGGGAEAATKSAAAYDALNKSGADVIVAPKYTVVKKDYFFYKSIDVTVDGYAGKVNSIK